MEQTKSSKNKILDFPKIQRGHKTFSSRGNSLIATTEKLHLTFFVEETH